ncbi:MAG: TetR/AcrR family transcriptional regulator [Deinococcales bacterium]
MSDTRERIVQKTAELLTLQGYHGTGLNQIVKESDTPRGSLYYYFPSGKEELAAEAVRYRGKAMQAHISHELAKFDSPQEAIYQLVQTMIINLLRRNFTTGAPVAGVAMEASKASEVLREACQEVYVMVKQPLYEKLKLVYGADADRLALGIVAALEGALVLAYTQRSAEPLEAVAEMVRCCLEKSF